MPFTLANISGRVALVAGDEYYDLEAVSQGSLGSDPMGALESADQLAELTTGLSAHQATGSLADVVLHAPVPTPRNSYGIGLNYRSHAAESNMTVPEAPLVFTKFPSCIVGPNDDVELRSERVDYEGEIVVVIGPGGKDIDEADAWNHVLGLTAGQDVSDRGMQMASKPPHFDLGKSFDTFGPIGPVLVSTDSFADLDSVRVSTHINGEERQNDTTASLMFSIPTLVSYLSRITTLQTGDLIFSGTPEGIGAVQGLFLADGDVITTTVEGVGTMTNRCVRISDHGHPTPNFPPR